jgi:hypothetical protein
MFTIHLRNPGPVLDEVQVTDVLPPGLRFSGNLAASGGKAVEAGGVITWNGPVQPGPGVTIRYDAQVDPELEAGGLITNIAEIRAGPGEVLSRQAVIIVNGSGVYLPLVFK